MYVIIADWSSRGKLPTTASGPFSSKNVWKPLISCTMKKATHRQTKMRPALKIRQSAIKEYRSWKIYRVKVIMTRMNTKLGQRNWYSGRRYRIGPTIVAATTAVINNQINSRRKSRVRVPFMYAFLAEQSYNTSYQNEFGGVKIIWSLIVLRRIVLRWCE